MIMIMIKITSNMGTIFSNTLEAVALSMKG